MTFLAIVISSGKRKKIRTRARGPRGGAAGEGGGNRLRYQSEDQ